MPLTLVTGRANSGKTAIVYRALADWAGKRATLLVPSSPDVVRARRDLSTIRPVGIRVSQLDRFLADIWALEGDGRRLVGEIQRVALCRRACVGTDFASARTGGFAVTLAAFVRRLAEHDRLPRSARDRDGIFALAARYATLLDDSGLIESGEACALLAAGVPSAANPDLLVAHRFTALGPAQEAYLLARAAGGARVLVTLVWEEGSPAMLACDDLACRLAACADEHVRTSATERRTGSVELARLEAGLFVATRPAKPEGALSLIEARGEEAEADGVAEQVAALLAGGLTGDEIAVVYRDPGRHLPALARALADARIPFDLDVRVPVTDTSLGRSVARLLAFAMRLERADLAAFLRSPFAGASPDAVDALEASWRDRRLLTGRGLLSGLDSLGADSLGIVLDAIDLAEASLDEASVPAWGALLGRMLRAAHGSRAPLLNADAVSDAAAHRAIVRVVEELAAFNDDAPAARRLVEALAWLLVQPAGLERAGHVQVMSAERVCSRRFAALLLAGLTAEEFPRGRGVGDEDAVAAALARGGVLARSAPTLEEERLLFYLVVTRARDRLVLSRQTSDDDGRPLRPSPFWEETLDLYRCSKPPEHGDLVPTRRVALFEELGLARSGSVSGRKALRALAAGRCGTLEERATLGARASAITLRRTGLSEADLAVLASRTSLRTSEIESYVRCPFRWFYERALGPRHLGVELGAIERGMLVHDALRLVYDSLEERTGSRRVTPETLDASLALAEEVFSRASAGQPEALGLEEQHSLRTARNRVTGMLRRDSVSFGGFEPIAIEWSFGPKTAAPGPCIAGVELCGRVDRVDANGDALLVMDYKSGRTVAYKRFERDGLVQLPLYAEAARRAFDLPLAGAFYRSLSEGANRGFVLGDAVPDPGRAAGGSVVDADGLEAVIASAVERAEGAIAGMRAGRIPAKPAGEETCNYCTARDVCGGPS